MNTSTNSTAKASAPAADGSIGVPGSIEVMVLQTAASLENVAADFYREAEALPCVRAGGARFAGLVTANGAHHAAHAQAFNRAATRLGAAAQQDRDPRYAAVVDEARPGLTSLAAVVDLALTLEDAAAQSFVRFGALVGPASLRSLFGSVAPVEAQHRAVLLAVQALLNRGAWDLVAASSGTAALPAAVGGAGFPATFYPAADASAVNEGTVR